MTDDRSAGGGSGLDDNGPALDERRLSDHLTLLRDSARMGAYQAALQPALCRDKIVLEIGVGLAPLTLMALRAGARRVYGIEADQPTLRQATAIVAANGFADRFVPLHGLSSELDLPERADVLIGEILDDFGPAEGILTFYDDARERLLKPTAAFVPSRLRCFGALARPRAIDDDRALLAALSRDHGLDYRSLDSLLLRRHALPLRDGDILSDWVCWQDFDLADVAASFRTRGVHRLTAHTAREALGVCFAWSAQLSDEVELSTLPDSSQTHWGALFFPLPSPLDLQVNQSVTLELGLELGSYATELRVGVRVVG
jgi:hypothetical protein